MTEADNPSEHASADRGGRLSFSGSIGWWVGLWLLLEVLLWSTGFRSTELRVNVEVGAAEVEHSSVGEIGDDDVREAIAQQRDSLRFWTALALVRDFVIGPIGLILRATTAAVLFAALGAARGGTIGFEEGLLATARAQGYWAVGFAVQAALMITLRRNEVENSAVLFLPSGDYPAPLWIALRQIEPFALVGWVVMARGAWTRGQSSILGSVSVVTLLWSVEASLRVGAALLLGAWTRQTLIPDV